MSTLKFARLRYPATFLLLGAACLVAGCVNNQTVETAPTRPNVAPATQPADTEVLQLDRSMVTPMYTELLPIDLPAVIQVARARNLDIQQARQVVEASRGEYQSTVGAVFPALVPTALFEHVEGTVRATEGNLTGVGFNTFQASMAVQWITNPGRVVYDIIAAKKRLAASGHQEETVILQTLRQAVVQYYELVLAQARISAVHQGVLEAEELLRINRLRTRTGDGVPADELRAEARLAEQRQNLIVAMRDFYDASVTLAFTLNLDPSVTLVPRIEELPPIDLVREDLPIQQMLDIAVEFRPDLAQVRALLEAAVADRGATWWGDFGPEFLVGYQYGGITGHSNNTDLSEPVPGALVVNPFSASGAFASNPVADALISEGLRRGLSQFRRRGDQTFSFSDQQRAAAGVGWRLSVAAFGRLKTAQALEEQVRIDAERRLAGVRAQVVSSAQGSKAHHELIDLARQQVVSAAEALRLTEANLKAGTMTTLDVLQAQDAAMQARLRHAEAVVRYNQSQINLLAALGLLDVSTVTPGVFITTVIQ